MFDKPAKIGAYRYNDGSKYFGDWNGNGQRHGFGHLVLIDTTRYDGCFFHDLFSGLGVLQFPDGAKYEGEFLRSCFHGHGIFWRADGMKFEGEFRGGKIHGFGLVTFKDGSHGYPRNEGLFSNCRLVSRQSCQETVDKAQRTAFLARLQLEKFAFTHETKL